MTKRWYFVHLDTILLAQKLSFLLFIYVFIYLFFTILHSQKVAIQLLVIRYGCKVH